MTATLDGAWSIGPDEVHLIGMTLDLPSPSVAGFERVLAPEERARAQRLAAGRDRSRWIAARGLLRVVLGAQLGQAPSAIRLSRGARGKPRSRGPPDSGLTFNLSHSGGRALIALARGREVGVDLKRVHTDLEFESIADVVFAAPERRKRSTGSRAPTFRGVRAPAVATRRR